MTYRKQIELNDKFKRFASNVSKAFSGKNEVQVQLAYHDWPSHLATHQFCEAEGSDEVILALAQL
jgi:hypothetical protein